MFDLHFDAFLADTPEALETHYQLRYQVFCVDTGWLDKTPFPDHMERDEWDDRSVAFLVRRRRSKAWIATMRLVRAPLRQLPVFRHMHIEEDRVPADAWDSIAEFSRLSVVRKYRRRKTARPEGLPARSTFEDSFLQSGYASESWIFLGLDRAAYAWSRANGLRYWVFFLAKPLAYIIERSGMDITPLGEEVDYCGLRRPYLFSLTTGAANLQTRCPEIYDFTKVETPYRLFSELNEDTFGVRGRPR